MTFRRGLKYSQMIPAAAGNMFQTDICEITGLVQKWLVKFNPSKSESLAISHNH